MATNQYLFPNGNLPGLSVNPTLDVFLAGKTGPALIQNANIQAFAGPNGTQIRFVGNGFQYDPAGNGIAGNLVAVQIITFDAIGNPVLQEVTVAPFPINSFAAFYAALNGPDGALGAVKFLMSGNDTVIGSNTNDDMAGHLGNDTLNGNGGNDHIVGGAGDDTINGGSGFDEADYSDSYGRPLTGPERATQGIFVNAAAGIVVDFQNNLETVINVESYTGTQFTDTMFGDGDAETFRGLGGNDFINGGGNSDTAAYDRDASKGGTAGVTVNLTTGVATDGFGQTDTLVNIENVIGSNANDVITGNGASNTLFGLDGNDILVAVQGGTDRLVGGLGDDTYRVDSNFLPLQIVDETGGGGIDTVESSVTWNLADPTRNLGNVENLTLVGGAAIAGFGNTLNNIITGNDAANFITGAGGNDTLRGNGGEDTLNGDSGNDVLEGGDGDDTLNGGQGNDSLDGGAGGNTLAGGLGNDTYHLGDKADGEDAIIEIGGNDTITSTISRSLQFFSTDDASNIENLTLLGTAANGTGSAGNNTITGNASNNTLIGLAGDDTLIGGAGDDVLNGGTGADNMQGGAGNDLYSVDNAGDGIQDSGGIDTVNARISVNLSNFGGVENATLVLTSNINATGSGLNNILRGNNGNNVLSGLGGNDTLVGNGGDDRLIGGNGADNLNGGIGDDTLNGGQGIDTMTGGGGVDHFVWNTGLNVNNRDVYTDFNHLDDTIDLAKSIFTALGNSVTADEFRNGTRALDATDHLIYNKPTGVLLYDSNGVAAGGVTQIATLTNHVTINHTDFALI